MPYRYSSRGAETRSLGDWPPLRASGPEPGSYDMPPAIGPLGQRAAMGAITMSSSERQGLTIALGLGAVWYFVLRKPKRGRRR